MFSSAEAAFCSACGLQVDIQGDHLLCCAAMGRYARHNALRDALARIAEAAGVASRVEQRVSEESRERWLWTYQWSTLSS